MHKNTLLIILAFFFTACEEKAALSDAYGNFEADPITVSSETAGRLIFFKPKDGDRLKPGELVAVVDTSTLHLQRNQIEATIRTLPKKLRNTLADIEVLQNQMANLRRERNRVQRLVEKKASTPKQLDDLNGQIEVVQKQIAAVRSQTQTGNAAILAEKEPLLAQKAIINEAIRKSYIRNPVGGTVLTTLSAQHEVAGPGTPLYRLANLDTMLLRFYADAIQIRDVKIGQEVYVYIDSAPEELTQLEGTVSWIASEAEFTPKTIQTKEDRVNLVYALKARVPNPDGTLKIGMPAEVNFEETPAETAAQ